jgi:excisionase family DNA binding protein
MTAPRVRQGPEVARSPKVAEQKFSIDSVAKNMSTSRSTVERLMNSGKLGYYRVGRRRIIGESHLEKYLSLIEREATADTRN